ncbi:MAG: hypothetical protein IPM48_04185 [Saprospiraceae bacterium]|nr:hypothetical protein [Saprospiraceae bacterium]
MTNKLLLLFIVFTLILLAGFKNSTDSPIQLNQANPNASNKTGQIDPGEESLLQTIDFALAVSMVSSWVDTIAMMRNITTRQGKRDSIEKSVYFSKADLETLINHLNSNNSSGVRVYFGHYGNTTAIANYLEQNNRPEYLHRFSLILQSTDGQGNPTQGLPLVNFGNLCPPRCPSAEINDLMYY